MEAPQQKRYSKRREEDGTWTVFDTTMPDSRENRIMTGISEERAGRYLERLHSQVAASSPEPASDQPPDDLTPRHGGGPEDLL